LTHLSKNRYDLIVFLKGEFVRGSLLDSIRKIQKDAPLINIFPDNPFFYFNSYKAVPSYDHFFIKDSYVLKELAKSGYDNCHYLPQPCSPRFHRMIDPATISDEERDRYGSDIAFIGSIYPQRQKILENLRGYDLRLWGKSIWDSVDRDSWILRYHQNKIADDETKCKIAACSKINLNTHNFQNDIFGCNRRVFEICGCGGFQLVDHKPDLDNLFRIGKEVTVFRSAKELRSQVQYYIENEDERKKIALAGYKRAQRDHTYAKRIKEALKIISKSQ
jgi:spore maturation protein CgeB